MKVLRTGLIGAGIGRSRFGDALAILCAAHDMELAFSAIDSATRPGFDFEATVARCRADGWHGVAVTHPYKTRAGALAGAVAPARIRHLGACNTLIFTPGDSAENTDHTGFLAAWRARFADRPPGRVAMAGAGGVACALAPALAELGAGEITVWDPVPGQARALAARVGPVIRAIPPDRAGQAILGADGLVNATPLGMIGHPGCAFAPGLIGRQKWAFDAVYTPMDTEFLQCCDRAGLALLTGFDLFRHMAIASFAALGGVAVDPEAMLAQLARLAPQPISA